MRPTRNGSCRGSPTAAVQRRCGPDLPIGRRGTGRDQHAAAGLRTGPRWHSVATPTKSLFVEKRREEKRREEKKREEKRREEKRREEKRREEKRSREWTFRVFCALRAGADPGGQAAIAPILGSFDPQSRIAGLYSCRKPTKIEKLFTPKSR
jgi:hypothetical protein